MENKIAYLKNEASILKSNIARYNDYHKGLGIEEILEVTQKFIHSRNEVITGSDFVEVHLLDFPLDSKSPLMKMDSSSITY